MELTSLWHDQAPPPDGPPLSGDTEAETVIVGAGFSGLWTSIYLKRWRPEADVLLVEAQRPGFGASGRNGGWCIAELAASGPRWDKLAGPGSGTSMHQAMVATVAEIEGLIRSESIDCDFVRGGELHLARNSGQAARLRQLALRDDSVRWLEAEEARSLCAATRVLGGAFVETTAALHPAKLVRELTSLALGLGVRLAVDSRVLEVLPGRIVTDTGIVRARDIVVATEAYTSALKPYQRGLVPLSSMMIATEPLPDSLWDSIGLADRPVFADGRHNVIYGQRTADNRIAFGGRVLPYRFGSGIPDRYTGSSFETIRSILIDLFPAVADAEITHQWGGVLGVPRNWTPFVELDTETRIYRVGGLIGEGVAATNLAGRTVAEAIVGEERGLVGLPWVRKASRRWPLEPFRWLGISAGSVLYSLADSYEEGTGRQAKSIATLNSLLRR